MNIATIKIRPGIVAVLAGLAMASSALADDFKVSSLSFTAPAKWTKENPSSAMRKAQFSVGEGDQKGEIIFYYFGPGAAGGVDANVKRWFGQFKEPQDKINAKTEPAKAGEVPVTYVSAQGTFLSGSPRGAKVEKPGYAMLAAIIEAKEGAIFAKFTGPAALVIASTDEFKKMIQAAK